MQAPWVEKYRPRRFSDIILDPANLTILKRLSGQRNMPHMLFYGPPGTGKTTVAEILIASRNRKLDSTNVLRLNASDQRGLVFVKSSIVPFVQSASVRNQNEKIIVLDEADYMTPHAHSALFRLIKLAPTTTTFIIICNHLYRMHRSLLSCLTCIHFRSPPKQDIQSHLNRIMASEGLEPPIHLKDLIDLYYPDIRSIINASQKQDDSPTSEESYSDGLADARALQTSPLRAATFQLENRLHKCSNSGTVESLMRNYCTILELSTNNPEAALRYFANFVKPNLEDIFDQESI